MQCIEKSRFSDRHFWHGGYDKAKYAEERRDLAQRDAQVVEDSRFADTCVLQSLAASQDGLEPDETDV